MCIRDRGKSVLFFGKNVDFRPKQVGEKSQFSLISKAFSGKGGDFPFQRLPPSFFALGRWFYFFLSALYKSKKLSLIHICFLECSLKLYDVPQEQRKGVIAAALQMDLRRMAEEIIQKTVAQAEEGFAALPALKK